MQPSATVHIVDDEESVRRSLSLLIRSEGYPVRSYASVAEALEDIDTASRGCVLADVRMDGASGIDLLRTLSLKGVTLPVVIMTGHADVSVAVQAMKAGAADFIEKPFEPSALLSILSSAMTRDEAEGRDQILRRRFSLLTLRERQVLDHLLRGATNKVIALALDLSPRTVEIYRAKLMLKMQAGSLSELVQMAVASGIQRS